MMLNEWMNECMNKWMNEWTNEWEKIDMIDCLNEWMTDSILLHGCTYGCKHRTGQNRIE